MSSLSRPLLVVIGVIAGMVIAIGAVFGIVFQQSSIAQPQKYNKVISYDQ